MIEELDPAIGQHRLIQNHTTPQSEEDDRDQHHTTQCQEGREGDRGQGREGDRGQSREGDRVHGREGIHRRGPDEGHDRGRGHAVNHSLEIIIVK